MFFCREVTIPASTSADNPFRATLRVAGGLVTKLFVRWRWGSGGLCGARILHAGFQRWPLSMGQWFPSSPAALEFIERYWVLADVYEFQVEGYNTDDTFEHRVWVGVEMLTVAEATSVGQIPTPGIEVIRLPPETIIEEVPVPYPVIIEPALPPLPVPAVVRQRTFTLRYGVSKYVGTDDTWISKTFPDLVNGQASEMFVGSDGRRVALLHFGVADLPGVDLLQKAELVLFVTSRDVDRGMPFYVFPVGELWLAREATWIRATAQRWWRLNPLEAVRDGETIRGGVAGIGGAPGTSLRFDVSALVRAWLRGEQPNNGFAVACVSRVSARFTFASAQWGVSRERPALVVNYAVEGG